MAALLEGAGAPVTRRIRKDGYVDLWRPRHPIARRDGYVFEHRLVLHDAGITVPDGFYVHHINENRADNRLDNLAVVTMLGHNAIHQREGETIRNQHGEFVVGSGITRRMRERKAAMPPRSCAMCEEDISEKRTDARFCSITCRNRWHKRRAA